MNNGFTGINWEGVEEKFKAIESNGNELLLTFSPDLRLFFEELSMLWATKNAVEWFPSISNAIEEALVRVRMLYSDVLDYGSNIIRNWAYTTGVNAPIIQQVNPNTRLTHSINIHGSFFVETINGNSGMNTKEVKSLLDGKLRSLIDKCLEITNRLPDSIELYDTAGRQLESFRINVKAIQNEVTNILDRINNEIVNFITIEADNIELTAANNSN